MFSSRLRALREDHDLTQDELAKALNITREAISGYENTRREPNMKILIKIADYFNVSVDYLIGRTNDSSPYLKIKR